MEKGIIDPDFTRDVLESEIPRDVLQILLADRTTGKNIMWMTDGYKHLESVFDMKMGVQDQIDIDVISRPGNKIIRPRVDKSKAEQKERIQKKAEVFTPSWICNNMINEFDAAEFSFDHPRTGRRMEFSAPPPQDMAELISRLASAEKLKEGK